MALGSLAAHRLRSALTLLGVLVGVFSIILVMTAMRVMQSHIETKLRRLGTDTFQIQRWPILGVRGPEGWEKVRRRKRVTYEQALRLQEQATLALNVGAEATLSVGRATSRFAQSNPDVRFRAVSPGAFSAKTWVVGEGRGLVTGDVEGARRVCVLGYDLAKKLFPHSSALGEQVKFQGVGYQVVGVLELRGGLFGQSQDNFLAVPITTGLNRFGRERDVAILVRAKNLALFNDTIEQARGILRTLHKVAPAAEDDFDILTNEALIEQFRAVTFAVRLGVAIVSSIALLAAGVGIMNIMLVSVTERTREIGIRRAIGAKKRTILFQFILEAIVLCEIGGVIGVVLGVAGGNLVSLLLEVTPVLPIDWVALGLFICSLVGVLFGTYPAFKAANLDPIESLRYE